MPRTIIRITTVALLLLITACNQGSKSNPPPSTITGGTPVLPQRKLICRLREAFTGDDSKANPAAGVDIVHLDASTTTTANVGDMVRVELEMNSGTGYQWTVGGDNAQRSPSPAPILVPQFDWKSGTGQTVPITPNMPGGPVHCIFEFNASQAGSTTLIFSLTRSWEKGVPPTDKRVLIVNVGNPNGS